MSSVKRTTALTAALASIALAGVPAPGMAQEDGVFVDPESPAGKEYAVPLEEARRDSQGRDGDEGGRSGATEYRSDAFGDGIDKGEGASGSDGDGPNGSGNGSKNSGQDTGSDSADDAERTSESTAATAASGDDDGDGGGLSGGALTVILLLLVVGGGSLLAWFLRRGEAGSTTA